MNDKILVWNIQGLPRSRKRLKNLVRKFCVLVVAVSEPFVDESSMLYLASFLDFQHFCYNEDMGGKFWLLWKIEFSFERVFSFSQTLVGWCSSIIHEP